MVLRNVSYYLQFLAKAWHWSGVDGRGLRKVIIAAILVAITSLYMSKLGVTESLMYYGPSESYFVKILLVSLVAGVAGVVYLWRAEVRYAVIITLLAIVGAHWAEDALGAVLYNWAYDWDLEGDAWLLFMYVWYAVLLVCAYLLAYALMALRPLKYRYKLIIAGVFIAGFVCVALIQGKVI